MDQIITTFAFSHLASADDLAAAVEEEALGGNMLHGLAEVSGYLEAAGIASADYNGLVERCRTVQLPSDRQTVLRQIAQQIRVDRDRFAKILPKMRLQKLRFSSRETARDIARRLLKPRSRQPQQAFAVAGDGGLLLHPAHRSSGSKLPPALLSMAGPEPVQATSVWVNEELDRVRTMRNSVTVSRIRGKMREAKVDRLIEEGYGNEEARGALFLLAAQGNEGAKAGLRTLAEHGFNDARESLLFLEPRSEEAVAKVQENREPLVALDEAEAVDAAVEEGMAVTQGLEEFLGRLIAQRDAVALAYVERIASEEGGAEIAEAFKHLSTGETISPKQWRGLVAKAEKETEFLGRLVEKIAFFSHAHVVPSEWDEWLLKINISVIRQKALDGDEWAVLGLCQLASLIGHAEAMAAFAEIVLAPPFSSDRLSGEAREQWRHALVGGILDEANKAEPNPDAVLIVRWLRSIGHIEFED